MGQDQVHALPRALVGRHRVAQRHMDEGVAGVRGEGEQAGEAVQSVVVPEEHADGLGSEQRRVAQRLTRPDDTVLVRTGAGAVLEQSQLHAGNLTGP
ncbi:hypothetical protein [Streptomyces tendae]|uniref:hypothetical protein n=1 Tax=Streptomyces tendae TaxID=1932 RepID=UPI0019D22FBE|nr:hypothetical protein [Streptomyces tendae]